MDKAIDYNKDWVWLINDEELIPPFCVEVILTNGDRYFLHSIIAKDDETKSMVVRIWDLRAFEEEDIKQLKDTLNTTRDRSALADAKKIHPKLDWANVRMNLNNIDYCVEWNDRLWPEEKRPQVGFST